MARHLGARLVAEAAIADGWGDPTGWLRDAEEYFHSADVPAAALACRSLLRRAGATVGHRRQGYEAVPEARHPFRARGLKSVDETQIAASRAAPPWAPRQA